MDRTEATFDAAESADWDCNTFLQQFFVAAFFFGKISALLANKNHPLLSTETTEYLNGYNFPCQSYKMDSKSFKPKYTPKEKQKFSMCNIKEEVDVKCIHENRTNESFDEFQVEVFLFKL